MLCVVCEEENRKHKFNNSKTVCDSCFKELSIQNILKNSNINKTIKTQLAYIDELQDIIEKQQRRLFLFEQEIFLIGCETLPKIDKKRMKFLSIAKEFEIKIDKNQTEFNEQQLKEISYKKVKRRRDIDPRYRFIGNMRVLFNQGFKYYSEKGKTKTMIEYGVDYSKIYDIVGPNPSNENTQYHMDHIIPIAEFDFDKDDHVQMCWSACNLRWVESYINLQKSATIDFSLLENDIELKNIAFILNKPWYNDVDWKV